MLISSSDSGQKKTKNHFVPTNVVNKNTRQLTQIPLCTLIVTFSDNENKDVTSAHVFTTTTPQLYPQTRKTVYQNGPQMSLTSTPQSTDDERYSGYTNSMASPPLSKPLVQEISLSYSAPYTATTKNSRQYEMLDSVYEKNDVLHSHSRLSRRSNSANKTESVERFLNSGRIETEFPAKKTEAVPYFSAQSAIQAGRITPANTPRATPAFDQASTARLDSALSQNTFVSESTTFEELTTITTSNGCSTRKKEIKKTEMPTVNALTKQFEASSTREKTVPLRPRRNSNTPTNHYAKSKSRVVVIDKSGRYSNNVSNPSTVVYPPGGILTTTIVDIEPARFGRRTEEYKVEEEYIVKRYDSSTHNTHQQSRETKVFEESHKASKHYDSDRENIESPVDTSSIDVVRNVIDQFETKIGAASRAQSHEQLRSISRVDMNENNSEYEKKIIVHQRSESQPVERIIPISPLPPVIEPSVQSGFVQNYEEINTISIKQTVDPIYQEVSLEEETLSPPPANTPLPTSDVAEETVIAGVDHEVLTTKQTIAEHSVTHEESNKEEELEKEKTSDKNIKHVTDVVAETETVVEDRSDEYLRNTVDRDYKFRAYEEWSTTTRRRDRSQPPERRSPASYSTWSDRSRSIDRKYDRKTFGSSMSRTYSEGRGLASGAYTGGLISGNLVSGMSSAGAICTTQLRDAREREKREIGLLNDRLADYIEKVRFLEAQNQCLSHDIDILRRGFSGGGHVQTLYDSEFNQAKRSLEQIIAGRTVFEKDITGLSAEIDVFRTKWLEAVGNVKAHRSGHDVDLDRLAKIEAEISLFKRKIHIVEEDVIRIKRENERIYHELSRTRGLIHNEVAIKNERSLHVTDLLQRIKLLEADNCTRIEQELVFIRRDTTEDNRAYFRQELQAAIRDIRADYESISLRNRQEIEVWYREQVRRIHENSGTVNVDLYRDEIVTIRSTLTAVKTRLAELESRNYMLEKLITDLGEQQANEAKFFEISLAEKDSAIAKLREKCTEISIQMEKLCDTETSLRAEIERYRVLLNGANVTTHTSHGVLPASDYRHTYTTGGVVGTTKVVSQTTRTHSSSNTSYSGIPASRHSGISVGGNIGGISVGGTIGATQASAHISSSSGAAGSEKRPDRIHDEKGTDESGRDFHRWYLGTISVNQVTPDFIELKNICKIRRVDVGGFRIEQSVDGSVIGSAMINVPLILDPQEVLRINTKNIGQFFMDVDHFDTSVNARTSLFNYTEPTEERGWFVYLN